MRRWRGRGKERVKVWLGEARRGVARHGKEHGLVQGRARRGRARRGRARQGLAGQGLARREFGKVQGAARHGWAMHEYGKVQGRTHKIRGGNKLWRDTK